MLLNCYQPILVVERRLRGELKEGYCCVRLGKITVRIDCTPISR
uniref:Uncharacterized protein n=1 Tax=Anguilla anguilla TaxID=7936 RepID=A0A0E9TY50_ANGAN